MVYTVENVDVHDYIGLPIKLKTISVCNIYFILDCSATLPMIASVKQSILSSLMAVPDLTNTPDCFASLSRRGFDHLWLKTLPSQEMKTLRTMGNDDCKLELILYGKLHYLHIQPQGFMLCCGRGDEAPRRRSSLCKDHSNFQGEM